MSTGTWKLTALLTLAACDSSPKPQPATDTPAVDAPPAESTSKPVFSPDNSVRRSHPAEVVKGRAPLASECDGDACGGVTVTWLDPGYRFENTSSRAIAIRIWFAAEGDCLLSVFSIEPAKSSGWGNVAFCKPYSATVTEP